MSQSCILNQLLSRPKVKTQHPSQVHYCLTRILTSLMSRMIKKLHQWEKAVGRSQEIRFKASLVSSLLMIRLRTVILYLQAKLLEALPLRLVMLLYLRRE